MIEIKGIDPKMTANNTEPFEPTHPGELLRDEIECRHISRHILSLWDCSPTMICRRPKMTNRLLHALKMFVNLWMPFERTCRDFVISLIYKRYLADFAEWRIRYRA